MADRGRRVARSRYYGGAMERGGGDTAARLGREALAYSQWLLHNGWSLLIYPEG